MSVTNSDALDHLKNTFPDQKISVEDLPKRDTAKSRAFKIAVDADMFVSVISGVNWPNGIIVKKFHFFRRSAAHSDVK